MGSGAAGMFETTMVAILVSAICALISEHGGFTALLNGIQKVFKGKKSGQLGMGLLVGAMDIATANNTVAIISVAGISKDISVRYHLDNRRVASILDTFSCIMQGIIPYGAQMLMGAALASVSSVDIIPYLYYPYILAIFAIGNIIFRKGKNSI
jgi:Na+/H+ antiporter NhaC